MTATALDREILTLEKRYWKAIKDKNLETALSLTDDPCIIAGASGVATIDKSTFRQIMQSETYTLTDFEIEDVQFRELTPDFAVMAYKVREDLTVDGKALTLNAADSSVWVRRGRDWRCVMHTESVLGDPYGRDNKQS